MNHQDPKPPNISRRELIQAAGAGIGALAVSDVFAATRRPPDPRFEHGQPLQEISHGQVELAPGLHETQLEETRSVVMSLDDDSLLRSYRQYAGLPTPGCPLGGVYDGWGDAEHFGAFVSTIARYHAIKPNEAARAKVERLIAGFAQTIEPTGKIFPKKSGSSTNTINTAKYHRIVRALIDAHRFMQNPIALDALARMTDAIIPLLPKKVGGNSAAGWNLTLPDTAFQAWQYTGDSRYLEIATRNLYEEFFDRLVSGEHCLGGRNAEAHMGALAAAAKAYLVLGDDRYLQAAKNGFALVEAQSYATGGWGPNECFLPSPRPFGDEPLPEGWMPEIRTLGESLSRTHWHFHLLSAQTHLIVASYLLRITRQASYGDNMERLIYNTVLGAMPLQKNGRSFYYCDYHNDGYKIYFNNWGSNDSPLWPLEAAILPMIAADYRIHTYFRDEAGVYVNWFIPSTLKWQQGGLEVSLTQTGTYPLGTKISFELAMSRPRRFNLRLRIPAWADRPSISVNGKPIAVPVKPGTFAALDQQWRPGDRIELELPRKLTLKPVDAEHPDLVALVYGPLVLFAVTAETPQFTREQLLAAERVAPDRPEWRVKVGDRSIRFAPFWAFRYERYSTYLSVLA